MKNKYLLFFVLFIDHWQSAYAQANYFNCDYLIFRSVFSIYIKPFITNQCVAIRNDNVT